MTDVRRERALLKSWRLWIVIAALVAPLADTLVSFGPPWPSMSAAVFGAVICELLAFALSGALTNYWHEGAHKVRWWLVLLGGVLVTAFCLTYVSLASRYIHIPRNPRSL